MNDFEDKTCRAAERAMAWDVDAEFVDAASDLEDITEKAPTLKQRFLTCPDTFNDWIGDAICGAHGAKTMAPIREMLMYEDDTHLGMYIRNLVMDYITAASREAENG